jgi:glycosyltransferase involved in cell wall biosynthesis
MDCFCRTAAPTVLPAKSREAEPAFEATCTEQQVVIDELRQTFDQRETLIHKLSTLNQTLTSELVKLPCRHLMEIRALENVLSEQQMVIDGLKRICDECEILILRLSAQTQARESQSLETQNTTNRQERLRHRLMENRWLYSLNVHLHKVFAPHRYPKIGRLCHHDPIPIQPWGMPPLSRNGTNKAWPSISIVTPSFRQAGYIARTMESVLNQNYPNLEYFVQDGGSTDGTVEIIERYANRLSGWQSESDDGQSHAINLGFAKTKGEIMAWLNSDDLLMPGTLAYVAEYFTRHPEVDVIYGHRILIDEHDREIGRWVLPPHSDSVLSWADFVPQETLFWRRTIWEKTGGKIDDTFRFAMDWDLLLRFRKTGARMVRLPRFLGAFRIHEAQKTLSAINDVGYKEMHRLRERELGRVVDYKDIHRAILPYAATHITYDIAYRLRKRLWKHLEKLLNLKTIALLFSAKG